MKDIIYKIYKTLYKGFLIERDDNLIKKLKNDGIKELMIIKKSWIFGLLISWVLFVTFLIGFFNIFAIYSLSTFLEYHIFLYIIIGIMIYSILSLIFNSIEFLIHFKKTYGNLNTTKNIDIVIKDIEKGDKLFKKFFSKITLNIFIFTLTTFIYVGIIIHLYNIGAIQGFWENFFIFTNILLFLVQIMLMYHYRRRMVNFDMTYTIVVPGEMYFVNQRGFVSEIKTIESDIIRTIDGKYPNNFLFSMLDLGTIEIVTIGALEQIGTIDMTFINKPELTAINIKDILLSEEEKTKKGLEKLKEKENC